MENNLIKPFGYELLLDAYDCAPSVIDDINVVYNFLEASVAILGVSKQSPPFVFHSPLSYINTEGKIVDCSDKAGISAWIPLLESGIQIHTLTDKRFISVDFYTCSVLGLEGVERLVGLVEDTFHPETIHQEFLERGKEYYQYD